MLPLKELSFSVKFVITKAQLRLLLTLFCLSSHVSFEDRIAESVLEGESEMICSRCTLRVLGRGVLRENGKPNWTLLLKCQRHLCEHSLMPTMKINPAGTEIIQNELAVSVCNWKQVRYVFLANCYASVVILISQAIFHALSTGQCLFCGFLGPLWWQTFSRHVGIDDCPSTSKSVPLIVVA